MSEIKISFFASAIRVHLWKELFDSLRSGKYKYEIIFAGHVEAGLVKEMYADYPEFKYITTGCIKPAQCYEIARRACQGYLICWIADDCIFSEGFVDKIYNYWTSTCVYSDIISCKTDENGKNETMLNHRFFYKNQNTPLMAPIGVMRRDKLEQIGGIDKRYICGQYENDLVMRILENGGRVHLYEDVCVFIDHSTKHKSNDDFKGGYNEDREQLENSWCVGGYKEHEHGHVVRYGVKEPFMYLPICNHEVNLNRNDKFEPYPADISFTHSERPQGQWITKEVV